MEDFQDLCGPIINGSPAYVINYSAPVINLRLGNVVSDPPDQVFGPTTQALKNWYGPGFSIGIERACTR